MLVIFLSLASLRLLLKDLDTIARLLIDRLFLKDVLCFNSCALPFDVKLYLTKELPTATMSLPLELALFLTCLLLELALFFTPLLLELALFLTTLLLDLDLFLATLLLDLSIFLASLFRDADRFLAAMRRDFDLLLTAFLCDIDLDRDLLFTPLLWVLALFVLGCRLELSFCELKPIGGEYTDRGLVGPRIHTLATGGKKCLSSRLVLDMMVMDVRIV